MRGAAGLALALALASVAWLGGAATAMPVAVPTAQASQPLLYFDPAADAAADLAAARARAGAERKRVLVVFGADWCHDSRALMGWLTVDRLAARVAKAYIVVPVDVGAKDRNLDLARSLGLDGIAGTPTMLMLDADGRPLNLADAPRWRNAHAMGRRAVKAALFPRP